VRLRTPTPDLIAKAFAEAVASGEHEAAEGWLAVATYAEARRSERRPPSPDPRPRRRHETAA
jgi:hypothetical protein